MTIKAKTAPCGAESTLSATIDEKRFLELFLSKRPDPYQEAIDYLRAEGRVDSEYLNEIADLIEKLLGQQYEDHAPPIAECEKESPESLSQKRAVGKMLHQRQKEWSKNQRSSAIEGSESPRAANAAAAGTPLRISSTAYLRG